MSFGPGFSGPFQPGPDPAGGLASVPSNPYDINKSDSLAYRDAPYSNFPLADISRPPPDLPGLGMRGIPPSTLFRGWLVENPGADAPFTPGPGNVYRLYFHYNPASVTEDWSINPNVNPPDANNPQADGGGFSTQGVALGLHLIFDRTNDLKHRPSGVLFDTRIVAKILTQGHGGPGTNFNAQYFSPVSLVLGRTLDPFHITRTSPSLGGRAALTNPLGCTGYITSWSMTYTRFNKDMTPVRAEADLTVQVNYFMPNPSQTPGGIPDVSATPVLTRVPLPGGGFHIPGGGNRK